MWNTISSVLLTIEVFLLVSYAIARLLHKKINETVLFVTLVFVTNLALYFIPYCYKLIELQQYDNIVFELLACITGAIKLFAGDIKPEQVSAFTNVAPIYEYTYMLGALLAILATVSAAIDVFSGSLANALRLSKRLNADACDIVVGNSPEAISYANNSDNSVLLLSDDVSRDAAVALIADKHVVLRRNFTDKLLRSRILGNKTKFNIVIPKQDKYLEYMDTFIQYKQKGGKVKNISLYVEVDEAKAHTIRRELVEKNGMGECIFTFSRQEILAHNLMENYPITEFLPSDFVDEDASIKADKEINVYFLGFTELSQEIYRQSILNNQLVSYVGEEYKVKPINYHLWDKNIDAKEWAIDGLKHALDKLAESKDQYFELPEMPYVAHVEDMTPYMRDNLEILADRLRKADTYNIVVVDTNNVYRNIDTASRITSMMDGYHNYHMFVCSDIYAVNSAHTTYYGDYSKIYSHNIVVNDALSMTAKGINVVYTKRAAKADEIARPDFDEYIATKAEKSWRDMNYFTMTSNIYSAMNLRVKLNLLGLTYTEGNEPEGWNLISQKYGKENKEYKYDEYFTRSKRNSLLAQEHARWNAYHLLQEFMPMTKEQVKFKGLSDKGEVLFVTKNMDAKKHSCLTTFKGLSQLDAHKVKIAEEQTGMEHKADEFEVYKYDEMLIEAAGDLAQKLNFQIWEK